MEFLVLIAIALLAGGTYAFALAIARLGEKP